MRINHLSLATALCALTCSYAAAQQETPAKPDMKTLMAQVQTPSFDGVSGGGESSSVPAVKPDLPDAPKPNVKPEHTKLEKDLFWSTAMGYHAAFAADFTTTGMVLGRGGYETDHLYTQFGNKNAAGVIGSAVALHVAATAGSIALYEEAKKFHGVKRVLIDAAAIGINAYGIGVHTQGAAHNAGVLNNWNSH
jgi:hypothetical protein